MTTEPTPTLTEKDREEQEIIDAIHARIAASDSAEERDALQREADGRSKRLAARREADRARRESHPVTLKRLHSGYWQLVAFLAVIGGLVGAGLALRPNELSVLFFVAAGFPAMALPVWAFSDRCPRCRGVFTRKVVSRAFSHSVDTQSTHHYAGDHRTATTTRSYHQAAFVCRRCGLTWSGHV